MATPVFPQKTAVLRRRLCAASAWYAAACMFVRSHAATTWLFLQVAGCTQTLDFDQVSTGQAGADRSKFSCAALKPAPTFCDDFDSRPPRETWSTLDIQPDGVAAGGSITTDTGASVSAPNALLTSVREAD